MPARRSCSRGVRASAELCCSCSVAALAAACGPAARAGTAASAGKSSVGIRFRPSLAVLLFGAAPLTWGLVSGKTIEALATLA